MAVWYILWSIGIFLPALVFCTKKNLANPDLEAKDISSSSSFCCCQKKLHPFFQSVASAT
jgi:hypothetical protein